MKKRNFELDDFELRIIVRALIELRNQLISDNKSVEETNDILLKIIP